MTARTAVREVSMFAVAAAVVALAPAPAAAAGKPSAAVVRRGEQLVAFGGCNDCHTPWKMGPKGPAPDRARLLSGHPQDLVMPPQPAAEGPWIVSGAGTMTAWAGPWGVSYAANLTPDPETGLGRWTERNFVEAMRTGRHMGRGRPILPPMPTANVASLGEGDLKAVFAYLRTIPAIRNRVPEPTPPPSGPAPSAEASSAGGAATPSR